MALPARRRKPRTPVGKAIRAWPWVRRGLKIFRIARRAWPVIRIAAVVGVVAAIARRLQRRRRASVLPTGTTPNSSFDASGAASRQPGEPGAEGDTSG
jgi:phage-related protein